jgi:hypothetical protein
VFQVLPWPHQPVEHYNLPMGLLEVGTPPISSW